MEQIKQWVDFVRPYFASISEAKKFVKKCENLPFKKQNAMLILHQAQRLVTLADDIYKIRPRDSLRLFFLIVCAEAIAKLYANYEGKRSPRDYVHKFFCSFCDLGDLKLLNSSFSTQKLGKNKIYLSHYDTIDLLYDIRCSVVHEGCYWEFNFNRESSDDPTEKVLTTTSIRYKQRQLISTTITYEKFRNIIVKGAIKAIKDYLQ